MNNYLILFTIGPVQSFISQARKTQDLYAGSKLLSDLINNAMDELMKLQPESEFIFPSPEVTSKPNRFIALLKMENEKDVENLGNKIADVVQEKLKTISESIFNAKLKNEKKPINFDTQIKDHLQIYWTALKVNDNEYPTNFKKIEASLGSLKNFREFDQLEETGRKCSLCGEKNALVYNSIGNDLKEINPISGLRKKYYQGDSININNIHDIRYSITKGEGLCAVCFTKRFYDKDEFPSTAEISLMDSIEKLENPESGASKYITNYKNLFSGKFDSQLYYEENLNSKYFEKQDLQIQNDKSKTNAISNIKENYKSISKFTKENKIKLTKHYALVMFDGDSMGEWLSGKKLKEGQSLREFHKSLSQKLGEFAKLASDVIIKPKGRIIYAGGEDFLALINVNHLFKSLKTLRELFDNIVSQGIVNFKKNESDMLSFSAGIVIAHYKMPFSEILKSGRAAEKESKEIDNMKNAFAINVLKHSGEIEKCIFKWGDKDNITKNLDLVSDITKSLHKDEYSNTFIKNLELEFTRLTDHEGLIYESKLIETEINRLVKNSCNVHRNPKESKEDFKKRVTDPFINKIKALNLASNKKTKNFFSALNTAEYISRHLNGVKNDN